VNAAFAVRERTAPAEWRLALPLMREPQPKHGSGLKRHSAHAFNFARGMHIAAHDFALDLRR
jgi:hypothetical protein